MRKNRIAAILLSALMCIALWGCGGDGSSSDVPTTTATTTTTSTTTSTISVNLSLSVGSDIAGKTIAPLLGVNAGPTPQGDAGNQDVTAQYKAIGTKMVRTHDLYGPLDMSVMYPDRSKDPNLDSSYNLTSSDTAFNAIVSGGFEPFMRIGDSWNNVVPPTTLAERTNWANAAKYIVGHYLGNNRFKYVEIGNEPDFTTQFWPSPRTQIEFFDLYVRTAKAIKAANPDLKVGGSGFTQAIFSNASGKQYLADFIAYVKANSAPLDFLSWHCYSNEPTDYLNAATYIRQQLDASGFNTTESVVSEFNTSTNNADAQEVRLGGRGSAIITGSWIALQKGGINQSILYRGNDTSMNLPTFYGLFYANGTFKRNAHAFSLWSKLTAYPSMLDVSTSSTSLADLSKIWTLAGRDNTGKKALLVANTTNTALTTAINGLNAPLKLRVVSDANTALQESTVSTTVITIPAYGTALITSDGI